MNHGSADDGLSSRGRPPLNKLLAKIASPESELPREEYAWFEMAASEHIATLPKTFPKVNSSRPLSRKASCFVICSVDTSMLTIGPEKHSTKRRSLIARL